MPLYLILIAGLSLPLPNLRLPAIPLHWGHAHSDPFHGWRLQARTDHFSAGTVCRLTKGQLSYQRRAVVIQLPRNVDTSAAVYRIDGGPPRALARRGFALHRDDLTNPSGGLVRVPIDRLQQAGSVSVEARAMGRPVKFRLDGLTMALDAARAAGCTEDSFN